MTVDTPAAPAPRKPRLRQELQLLICALGIYLCYLRYGLLQERIYTHRHGPDGEHFHFTSFLLLIQVSINALTALVVLRLGLLAPPPTPASATPAPTHYIRRALPEYAIVSLAYLSAMLFSFSALRHMSYPMQALGKSCKMIPVMLMGVLIRKRRYAVREYLCVALVTLGVALFSWKSNKAAAVPASPIGFVLLFASLLMDGVTGPLQERLVARHNPSTHQLMFWQNICSAAWLALGSVASGEAAAAVSFVVRHPAVIPDVLLFALVSAVGQNFIFYTVRNFNSLIVTTITTTRKMFTVLLSIFVYQHAIVPRQWLGLALVFSAIAWEAVAKQKAKATAKVEQPEEKKVQ